MRTEFKKLPKCLGEVSIEMVYDEVVPYLNKAALHIAEEKEFPGFRKGKAPYAVVEKAVGEVEILQHALDEIMPEKFFEFLKEKNLEIVGRPKADILKMAPQNPIAFKLTFALLPDVKVGDWKKIKIKKQKIEIKGEEVDKFLKEVQKMRAEKKEVGREAKNTDEVLLDIQMSINNVPIEGGQSKDTAIILGDACFIPGLDENILGMKKGENKKFSLKYPDEHYDKNLAGKMVDFEIKLNKIHAITLPEINDELAKKLGKFENLNCLKEKLKENLKIEKEHEQEHQIEKEMLEKIVQESNFDELPDVLIEHEIEKMLAELKQELAHQELDLAQYLLNIKKTEQDLQKDFIPMATKRVKTALALKKISDKENIIADETEVTEEVNKILALYPNNEELKDDIQKGYYHTYVRNVLVNRKTIDFLKKQIIKD